MDYFKNKSYREIFSLVLKIVNPEGCNSFLVVSILGLNPTVSTRLNRFAFFVLLIHKIFLTLYWSSIKKRERGKKEREDG